MLEENNIVKINIKINKLIWRDMKVWVFFFRWMIIKVFFVCLVEWWVGLVRIFNFYIIEIFVNDFYVYM